MKREKLPETNLDGLIQRIKEEGIEEAEKKTEEITVEAEQNASEIREAAKQEAQAILKEAEEGRKREVSAGKKVLEQAARDTILRVKESLAEIFYAVLKEESGEIITGKPLERIIAHIVDEWTKERDKEVQLEFLLNKKDKKALSDFFLSKLKQKLTTGIEINAHPRIEAGFHVGVKGGNFYYDFTDDGIADVLAAYLNPRLGEILNSVKGEKEKE